MRWKSLLIALPALALPSITYSYFPGWSSTDYEYWVVDITTKVIVPLLCLILLYKNGIYPRDYGLLLSSSDIQLSRILSLGALCSIAFLSYIVVANVVRAYLGDPIIGDHSVPRKLAGPVSVLYHLLTASFVEEIFFRGVLGVVFLTEPKPTNAIVYVVISSASFAVAHSSADLTSMISIFYLGIVASAIFLVTRNLWPLILAHFVTDAVLYAW